MYVLCILNHLASNKAHYSFFSNWPIPYLVLHFLSLILAAPSTQPFKLDALCIFHPFFQIHLFMKPYPRPLWTSFPLDCCNGLLAGLLASSLSSNSSSHHKPGSYLFKTHNNCFMKQDSIDSGARDPRFKSWLHQKWGLAQVISWVYASISSPVTWE